MEIVQTITKCVPSPRLGAELKMVPQGSQSRYFTYLHIPKGIFLDQLTGSHFSRLYTKVQLYY